MPHKVKMSTLNLVYAPISNHAASLGGDNEEFARRIAKSDFYMIGGRAKASFIDLKPDFDKQQIIVTISVAAAHPPQAPLSPCGSRN